MRNSMFFIAPVFAAALFLNACNSEQKPAAEQVQSQAQAAPLPADPNNTPAWRQYLGGVVTAHMEGVTSRTPYMYFVPGGDDDKGKTDRSNQLDNVSVTVARGVLPGNMMAFGGPNSAATADLIIAAYKDVQVGSFKNVVVLFIGAQVDADRVKAALEPAGATFRFVEMK